MKSGAAGNDDTPTTMNRESPPPPTTTENSGKCVVSPSIRFRDILDFVEIRARQTDALLFSHSRSLRDDIMEAWDHRAESKSYWMFCIKWMRGELLEAMGQQTFSDLLAILSILRPGQVAASNICEVAAPASKQRIIARLLPIMLLETVVRVHNASEARKGRCQWGQA